MAVTPTRRAAIVVNPTKFDDLAGVRARIGAACVEAGWEAPLWLETSADDPGAGQAREAVEADVDVVCALGGDGTVRAVAAGLVGTRTPLGLLPCGTGNLLARNLQLPLESIDVALEVALDGAQSGRCRPVDVGRLSFDLEGDARSEHIFLVMAGLGFDAAVMAGAPEALKKTLGWPAYVWSALRNLSGRRFSAEVRLDDGPPIRRRARAIVVGNCGQLTGGLALLPIARVDDGLLDAVILAPKGIIGWLAVTARVLTRRRHGHRRVEHHHMRRLAVRAEQAQPAQLDGETAGTINGFTIDVHHAAVLVAGARE